MLAVGGATVVENRDSRGGRVVGRRAYVLVAFSVRVTWFGVYSVSREQVGACKGEHHGGSR